MSDLLEKDLPQDFNRWNPALRGAYMKGRRSAAEGQQAYISCPYPDKKNGRGRVTWSRSFLVAWHDGFSDMERILEEHGCGK
jgi:hypothetical protein